MCVCVCVCVYIYIYVYTCKIWTLFSVSVVFLILFIIIPVVCCFYSYFLSCLIIQKCCNVPVLKKGSNSSL